MAVCETCNGRQFKDGAVTPVALFCDLTANAACPNPSVAWEIVCDSTGAKFYAVHLVCNGVLPGTITYYDFSLNPATPVLPTATCGDDGIDIEVAYLCDDTLSDGTVIVPFVRIIAFKEVDGTIISVTDKTVNAQSAYTVLGTVKSCSGSASGGNSTACVYDVNNIFTGTYVNIDYGTIPPRLYLLGTHTIYTLAAGEVLKDCSALNKPTVILELCDSYTTPCSDISLLAPGWNITGNVDIVGNGFVFSNANRPINGIIDRTVTGLSALATYRVDYDDGQQGAGAGITNYLMEVLDPSNNVITSIAATGAAPNAMQSVPFSGFTSYTIRFTDQTTNTTNKDLIIGSIVLVCVAPDPTILTTRFLRKYCLTCTDGSYTDLQLDGVTPYTIVGTVGSCQQSSNTIEVVCRCDDTNGDGVGDTSYKEIVSITPQGLATVIATYNRTLTTTYTPIAPVDCSVPGDNLIEVIPGYKLQSGLGTWTLNADSVVPTVSVTFTVITVGNIATPPTVTTYAGTSNLVQGQSVTWSATYSRDVSGLKPPLILNTKAGDVVAILWTSEN